MKLTAVMLTISIVAFFFCAGCEQTGPQSRLELQKQLEASRCSLEQLTARLREQEKQIATLQQIGPNRLKKLFVIESIKLGRYTGGIDTDKKPGQDAIKVFVKPLDEAGSVIKAAGSVKIQLFDLAASQGERLVAEFNYPVEKIGQYWSSGFMTYHYSFECSLKKPPKNPKITVRVEFTDYLTGKTFTAQKLLKITLPPAK